MSPAYQVRELLSADGAALLAFYQSLPAWIVHWFAPFGPAVTPEKLDGHLADNATGNAISFGLVDAAGAIAGHGFIYSTRVEVPVFGIGLREGIVGQGWGHRLMRAVLAEADRRELPRVALTVYKDNLRARRLYEALGFVTTGEHGHRQPGDSLKMVRRRPGTGSQSQRTALLELLAGRRPERVIWAADITWWLAGEKQKGLADPAWDTEAGFLALHRELGILPYYDYTRFWASVPTYDSSVQETSVRTGLVTRNGLRTPHGELIAEHTDLPESACSGCTKHFVQSEQDLDVFLDLLQRRQLLPANLNDYFTRLARWVEADGLPCLGLPRSPLAAFCYEWAGVENAVYLLLDQPDKVRQALQLMEAQEQPILDAVCRLAPPLVHFPDNLDSANLTPLYDEFLAGTHRHRLERLHAAGIRAAVHVDGAVRGLLPKLAAVGFDALEAVTPKPSGDMDIAEMRPAAGREDLVLWGGVPGALFAPPFTWKDMEAHVKRVLTEWHGQPFVLGVADQVPPNGDISFCRKIAEMLA